MQADLARVDWSRPWLAPYRASGERSAARIAAGSSVAEAINGEASGTLPVRFISAAELPSSEAYEAFIARTGGVPTRDNLHDFFNGLVWLAQPALKQRLNRLQAQAIARDGIGPRRGALRDALTLLDENGALIEAPVDVMRGLRERDWHRLFITARKCWAQVRLTLIGHALLEKLVDPYKAVTAHVWLGTALEPAVLETKPFAPLPVLGVPGWWPGNEAPGFYDDAAVFRPPRVPVDQAGKKPSIDR